MIDSDLVSRLEERPPPHMVEPRSPDDDPKLARSNIALAVALWAVSLALFAGTFLVAFAYLLLD